MCDGESCDRVCVVRGSGITKNGHLTAQFCLPQGQEQLGGVPGRVSKYVAHPPMQVAGCSNQQIYPSNHQLLQLWHSNGGKDGSKAV